MPANDFLTALGRLLRDGALRDAFAADPEAVAGNLNLQGTDRAALVRLAPADLEFQARILLRKRLAVVRRIIPETCWLMGDDLWAVFQTYARNHWPPGESCAAHDAQEFCRHLQQHHPSALSQRARNRLRFAFSPNRLAVHLVRHQGAPGKSRPALQLFLRLGKSRWREMMFSFRL